MPCRFRSATTAATISASYIFRIETDKFVNAGFNVHAVSFPTRRPAAHLRVSLEDKNVQTVLGEIERRRQASKARADHDRVVVANHLSQDPPLRAVSIMTAWNTDCKLAYTFRTEAEA